MAAIEKIYGTYDEYIELRHFLVEKMPSALHFLRVYESPYEGNRALSCFSQAVDVWLLAECPLEWVTDRIKNQYGLSD